MISKEIKNTIVETYKTNAQDTGSSVVQVALLTARINDLNRHFETNKKDYASKTGLMKLVGRRRRLLDYLNRCDEAQYKALIARLGLRR